MPTMLSIRFTENFDYSDGMKDRQIGKLLGMSPAIATTHYSDFLEYVPKRGIK